MHINLEGRARELAELLPVFAQTNSSEFNAIVDLIANCFSHDGKILICGNGGSAADSQHLAAEFVNYLLPGLKRKALPALALSSDTSVITSVANDVSFSHVFSRQVQALGNKGDVLIVFSTSGKSENCINAAKEASLLGLKSIAFTKEGAHLASICDFSIRVPSNNTQHIQECHLLAYHCLAEQIEIRLFGSKDA